MYGYTGGMRVRGGGGDCVVQVQHETEEAKDVEDEAAEEAQEVQQVRMRRQRRERRERSKEVEVAEDEARCIYRYSVILRRQRRRAGGGECARVRYEGTVKRERAAAAPPGVSVQGDRMGRPAWGDRRQGRAVAVLTTVITVITVIHHNGTSSWDRCADKQDPSQIFHHRLPLRLPFPWLEPD